MRWVVAALSLAAMSCAKPPAAPEAVDTSAAEALFQGKSRPNVACVACHGADATGTANGPNLRARAAGSDGAAWVATILDGEDAMPSYRGKLDEREAREIVAWLKRAR